MRRSGLIVRFKYSVLGSAFALAVIVLSGCAATGSATSNAGADNKPETTSQKVLTRAQQRWDALLKFDLNAAYGFISPAGRSTMTVEKYRPRVNSGFWRGAKAKDASCEAETCDVIVLIDITVEGVKTSVPVKEVWILEAGQWWFVYQG